jgi:hypothetical protein
MVGKATCVSSGGDGYNYALGKDEAEVLEKNGIIAENGSELHDEFKIYQEQNSRCKNNNINIIISPSPEDISKLNNEELRAITKDFMKKMELDKHQYVAVKHTPPNGRVHVHIYCNRINEEGKAYSSSYIGKKTQRMVQEIIQERGLVNPKEIHSNQQILDKENLKEIRQQIYNKHNEVMQIGKPRNFNEYIEQMKLKDVEVVPSITKQNKIQGFRVKHQGFDLKATQVHKNMSLSRTGLKTDTPKLKNISKIKPMSKDLDVGVSAINLGANVAKKIIRKTISKGLGY